MTALEPSGKWRIGLSIVVGAVTGTSAGGWGAEAAALSGGLTVSSGGDSGRGGAAEGNTGGAGGAGGAGGVKGAAAAGATGAGDSAGWVAGDG